MALYHLTDGDRLRLPDYGRIGKVAVMELRRTGHEVAPDDVALATYYAETAYEDLFRRSNYRPEYLAHVFAEQAAVEYVKGRLAGIPTEANAAYLRAAKTFRERAAVEHHVYGATSKDTTIPLGLPEALRDETGAYYEVDDDEAETP